MKTGQSADAWRGKWKADQHPADGEEASETLQHLSGVASLSRHPPRGLNLDLCCVSMKKQQQQQENTAFRRKRCCHLTAGWVGKNSWSWEGPGDKTSAGWWGLERGRGFCTCVKSSVYIYQDATASKNYFGWGRASRRGSFSAGREDVFGSNRGFFEKTVRKPTSGLLLPLSAPREGRGTCTFLPDNWI